MTNKITADEVRWRAEEDARTMARYEEIMADSKRKQAAVREARKMADDMNKRASAMNKVAGSRQSKKRK